MKAWHVLAMVLLLSAPTVARADACPAGTPMALHGIALDNARIAVATRRSLSILAVGGSASNWAAAGGDANSYTARLAARLTALLPGVTVQVTRRFAPKPYARSVVGVLPHDLAETQASIVIWGVGGSEAARHADIDSFTATLDRGITTAQAAKADVILMDVLYAPSIARMIDLTPYRDATAATASAHGVALLGRHGLMRDWSDAGALDLDATDPAQRMAVARTLFDCFATILADGIATAVLQK